MGVLMWAPCSSTASKLARYTTTMRPNTSANSCQAYQIYRIFTACCSLPMVDLVLALPVTQSMHEYAAQYWHQLLPGLSYMSHLYCMFLTAISAPYCQSHKRCNYNVLSRGPATGVSKRQSTLLADWRFCSSWLFSLGDIGSRRPP